MKLHGHARIVRSAKHIRSDALTNAQIIPFAPFLARKREQQMERAHLTRSSKLDDCDDIRAWVAVLIECSAGVGAIPPPFDSRERLIVPDPKHDSR